MAFFNKLPPFLIHTARFSEVDPYSMMQTCALTDGFIRTGIIALTYGQVSVNATRCRPKSYKPVILLLHTARLLIAPKLTYP
jgi:hypothetical protein